MLHGFIYINFKNRQINQIEIRRWLCTMQGKWKKVAQGTIWSDRNIVSCFLVIITNLHKIVKAQTKHSRSMWFLLTNYTSLKLKWILKKSYLLCISWRTQYLPSDFFLLQNIMALDYFSPGLNSWPM